MITHFPPLNKYPNRDLKAQFYLLLHLHPFQIAIHFSIVLTQTCLILIKLMKKILTSTIVSKIFYDVSNDT